ncbi:MAG: hypothetical protein Tsb0014_02770 [Pleurocapsa sp.]
MLHSLLQQNLFQKATSDVSVEIIVVPNGCTDDTALVAQKTLENSIDPQIYTNLTWRIEELKQSGKSNAWNQYVHHFSDPEANYLFLMDSDIELLDPQTLNSMISVLDSTSEAHVAVDQPIKSIQFKENKTWLEYLSVLISTLSGGNAMVGKPAWICGQLYCAKAEILRKIVLPNNLPVEDAFLYKMIVTDGLKSPQIPSRVILADSASHAFDAYTNISRLLRHEKWLIMGNTINELVWDHLLTDKNQKQNIATIIKNKNKQDSSWVEKLIKLKIDNQGWWLIPQFILVRRFLSLLNKPIHKSIVLFPVALMAFLVDLFLSVQANLNLHQGAVFSYWGKNQ